MKKTLDVILICSYPGPSKGAIVCGIINTCGKYNNFSSDKSILNEGYSGSMSKKDLVKNLNEAIVKARRSSKILIFGMTLQEFAKSKELITKRFQTVSIFVKYSQNDIMKFIQHRHMSEEKIQDCLSELSKLKAVFEHPANHNKFDVVVDASKDENHMSKIVEAVQTKICRKYVPL